MTTKFPAELDQFENPRPDTSQATARTHSQQHGDANDAIEALQAKVGTNMSGDPDSLDFKVGALENVTEGLDSAAYRPASDFATAAQGLAAESAVQPAQLDDATSQIQEEIDGLSATVIDGGAVAFPTWAEASAAATGGQLPLNRYVSVVGDPGTHVDPVSGATVSNSGRFVMTAAGLQWRSPDSLDSLNAAAIQYRGEVASGSVNSITAPGLYLVTAQLANMPAGAPATGLLEVNSYGNGNFLLHRFRGTDNARLNQYWERTSRLLTVPPQFPETWTYGPDAVGDGAVSRPKLTETYGFNGTATAVSANTLYREGCYVVGANVTDLPAGFGTGLLIATNFGDFVHQQLFTATSSQLVTKYERIIRPYAGSPSFPAWLDVSTNIVRTRLAAAYNQVGTISTGSFNDLTQEGNYTIGAALADGPTGWPGSGICRVSNHPGNFIKQVAEGVSYANVGLRWERLLRAGVSASAWKETPIATATVVGYGDSMTLGEGGGGTTYLTALSAALGSRLTINRGIGGQRSNQIAQRQGGSVP